MQDAKILIVEDESIIALDIKMSLQHAGYAIVEIARSGEEAIALAQSQQPDLILMDIQLQGPMDGIEAAQKIREQQSCPVVYLTAHTDSQTLDRAKLTAISSSLATSPYSASRPTIMPRMRLKLRKNGSISPCRTLFGS